MQLLFHIPDSLAMRFKQTVPPRQRSAFVSNLIQEALPEEDDPLYQIALAVEQDEALGAEMRQWRNGLIADGIRGIAEGQEDCHAAR